MKPLLLLVCSISVFLMLACTAEPAEQEPLAVTEVEAEPYLYKPPVTGPDGLPVAKLKKEALAEAFVTRLSTKAPAGVVVMQQENLVLEEYFGIDSSAIVSTGAMFPPYTIALLGSVYRNNYGPPFRPVPLEDLYPPKPKNAAVIQIIPSKPHAQQAQERLLNLEALIQQHTGTTMGFAAEEYLFEPLMIDEYKWQEGALWIHPHGILQLGSLLVKRGRWGDQQILSDGFVQRILAPAYDAGNHAAKEAYGWKYYRLVAKGRKHAVLYWEGNGAHLFVLPEVEAVVLLQGDTLMPEAWEWMQQYLIPSLTP